MTTWLAVAAIALATLSVVLFLLAIRRLLARQADVTATMLRRYDDRLASFAQTLNDALAAFQSARPSQRWSSRTIPSPWCGPSSSRASGRLRTARSPS